MKITRNGKEYELTAQELREAFCKQQELDQNDEVINYYENMKDEPCYWSEKKDLSSCGTSIGHS